MAAGPVSADVMSAGMAASAWSPEQRRLLRAMDYTLLRLTPTGAALPARGPAVLPATMPESASDHALLRALSIAAGGVALDELRQRLVLPAIAQLRDAAVKRALWPQLRVLRRNPH